MVSIGAVLLPSTDSRNRLSASRCRRRFSGSSFWATSCEAGRRAGPILALPIVLRADVFTIGVITLLEAAVVAAASLPLGLANNSRTPASVELVPPKTIVRPSRPLHPAAASPVQPEQRPLVGIRSVLRSVVWSFLSNGDVMRMVLPNRRR